MPLLPVSPPVTVPIYSSFDYVAVDSQRKRVYAAHTGSGALLVVNAEDGSVIGQVRVGPMHGVAVDPETGHVFTGNGTDDSVSEVDPVTLRVLRTADVGGAVDVINYDPVKHRLYATEDDGTHLYVVDTTAMKSVGTVNLPGHKPEYLAIDPATHDVYQNIANLAEVAVVDSVTLKVKRVFQTPEVKGNHPILYDAALGHLLIGGQNGTLAVYDTSGKLLGKTTMQDRVDQCSFAPSSKMIACAGSGEITVFRDDPSGTPAPVARGPAAQRASTVAVDDATGKIWVVWAEPSGDFVQAFTTGP